jgi:hypothetical protein
MAGPDTKNAETPYPIWGFGPPSPEPDTKKLDALLASLNGSAERFQTLALEERQAARVAAVEIQKVEGVKDQAHAARAVGRGLGLGKVWKAVLADAA